MLPLKRQSPASEAGQAARVDAGWPQLNSHKPHDPILLSLPDLAALQQQVHVP